MKSKTITLSLAMLTLTAGLSACSNFRFPAVFRQDIPQGNLVTQEMLDKLKPGMSRAQVRFVLGSPLIADSLHPERWDYLHVLKTGATGKREQKSLTVYFDNDRFARIEGGPTSTPKKPAAQVAQDSKTATDNAGCSASC